jgi:putative ABC transport system ATP-binding protein
MQNAIIKTVALTKTFNKGKNNEVIPVQEINLKIEQGTCVIIKGASGSGKTTLLTLLSCLSRPTSGEYICLQQKVSRWSEKFLTKFRRKNIGIVFQNFQLVQGLTVFQNIAIPLIPTGFSMQKINQIVGEVAEQVHIQHRLIFKVDTLSGGEMQRVAIARALVNQPQIIMADEPTSHLDSDMSQKIMDIFQTLKNEGKTLIISTHDPLVENQKMIDRVLVMRDGRLDV